MNRTPYTQQTLSTPPIWSGETVHDESVLFVKERDASSATASLFFTPSRIVRVAKATGETVYENGHDFTVTADARRLLLTGNSRIPFKNAEEMGQRIDTNLLPDGRARGMKDIFRGEGSTFHEIQVEVTYEHTDHWTGPVPEFKGDSLPHLQDILHNMNQLRIVAIGDSITAGANSSAFINSPPYGLPYPALVAATLRQKKGIDTTLVNLARVGQISEWGVSMMDAITEQAPDLLIVAFGTNDANSGVPDTVFQKNVSAIVERTRAACRGTEVVVLTPMLPNPDWIQAASRDVFCRYAARCRELAGAGIITVDLTSIWKCLLQRKPFRDITGNGLDHPNDFGHRVYAHAILASLLQGQKWPR